MHVAYGMVSQENSGIKEQFLERAGDAVDKLDLRAPLLIILEAMLTVSPNTQYRSMAVPIMPADTGPETNNITLVYLGEASTCQRG